MKLSDVPRFKRPREKLFEKGPGALSDAELLAILLRTGYHGKNVVEVAKRILTTYSIKDLLTLTPPKLASIKGVGTSRAATIVAAYELCLRAVNHHQEVVIITSEDVVKVVDYLKHKKQEHLVGLYLNARGNIIITQTISVGTLTASLIHPREVFAPALNHHASVVILAHNHPSGDPKPSLQDIAITKRLKEAGELLGITLADHVIMSKNGYQSLKEFCID